MGIEKLIIIGERINYNGSSKVKSLLDEISKAQSGKRDFTSIQEIARKQVDQGAKYIDVNVDMGPASELTIGLMQDSVRAVQDVVDIPLCIDSAEPDLLKAGLEVYDFPKGLPILNSATEAKADAVLELRKKYDCQIIFLLFRAMESQTEPDLTGEKAYETAKELFLKAKEYGFEPDQIYFDPALMPVGYYIPGSGFDKALGAIDKIYCDEDMQGAHVLVGLSNFTKDLQKKEIKLPLQNALLTLAIERGLDTIIGSASADYQKLNGNNQFVVALRNVLETAGYDEKFTAFSTYITPLLRPTE